ncbi:MAG: hypothetical protein AB1641_29030 [Thermodesulfobacteriota bacterium]
MSEPQVYISGLLNITVADKDDIINVLWAGKSVDRKPSKFITPILADVLMRSGDSRKRIVLDFRPLEYMNSSTITPVIKVLERVMTGTASLELLYNKAQNWQDLTFSALKIFETEDQRVQIKGT